MQSRSKKDIERSVKNCRKIVAQFNSVKTKTPIDIFDDLEKNLKSLCEKNENIKEVNFKYKSNTSSLDIKYKDGTKKKIF